MKRWILWIGILLLSSPVFANMHYVTLDMGQLKVINSQPIDRIAIGDGQVITAMTDDNKELVIFAKQPGITNMTLWHQQGGYSEYRVEVKSRKKKLLHRDILRILRKIPHIKVTFLEDNVMVEGKTLGYKDRQFLDRIMARFPQVVDMTTPSGGDEMILLDVQVLEIPRRVLSQMGVKWSVASQAGLDFNEQVLSSGALFHMNSNISASLKMLENEGSGTLLARPQLMARSGSSASFMAGGEVPYVMSNEKGEHKTSFKPYGVKLNIQPVVNEDKLIKGKIDIEVSSVDVSLAVESGPSFKTRRTSTEFNVASGQTLILAGFISREERRAIDKVPVLGDIPVLGGLFRSKQFQNQETELAILVRPMLLEQNSPKTQAQIARIEKKFVEKSGYQDMYQGNMNLMEYIRLGRRDYDERIFHPRWKPDIHRPLLRAW